MSNLLINTVFSKKRYEESGTAITSTTTASSEAVSSSTSHDPESMESLGTVPRQQLATGMGGQVHEIVNRSDSFKPGSIGSQDGHSKSFTSSLSYEDIKTKKNNVVDNTSSIDDVEAKMENAELDPNHRIYFEITEPQRTIKYISKNCCAIVEE